jgi:hypothetical protein
MAAGEKKKRVRKQAGRPKAKRSSRKRDTRAGQGWQPSVSAAPTLAHSAQLGRRHVRMLAPAGDPLGSDVVAVSLEKLDVRRLVTREPGAGGLLLFDLNGQKTTLSWQRTKTGAAAAGGVPQLLYVGRPKGILDLSIEMIESDAKLRGRLDDLRGLLESLAGLAATAPSGAVPGAGLGLAGALVGLVRASVDDDVELRFLGSLELESGSGGAPAGALPLRRGSYRLERQGPGEAASDIEMRLRVEPLASPEIDPAQPVTLVLDAVDLELRRIDDDDVLSFDIAISGGRQGRSRRPTRRELHFEQELENAGVWIERTVGIQGKVLYRGPWGEGLAFSVTVAALSRSAQRKLGPVIERAAALASALVPEEKEEIEALSKVVEGVRETAVKLVPEKRFAASRTGVIRASQKGGGAGAAVFNLPLEPSWQPLSVELDLGGHGAAKFSLWLRRDA